LSWENPNKMLEIILSGPLRSPFGNVL